MKEEKQPNKKNKTNSSITLRNQPYHTENYKNTNRIGLQHKKTSKSQLVENARNRSRSDSDSS